MKPKVDGDKIQVFLIESVYKKTTSLLKNKDGAYVTDMLGNKVKDEKQEFIKENFLKVWFYKEDLRLYGEYTGTKGRPCKNRCLVYNRVTQKPYILGHSLQEFHESMNELKNSHIGFKRNQND